MTEEDSFTNDETGDVVRRERFSSGPAREFLSSLDADERIFTADIAVDRAHVIMLAEQEILEADTAGAILSALTDIETAGHQNLPAGEDVHAAIETAVINRVGDEGGRMHTARSRNDEVATCIRYRLREDLLAVLQSLLDAREVLLSEAAEHAETIMPGYTHLQPAQPVTVGFWLASYENALARDTERILDAYDRVNQSPLGAAAFAGTTFDIDRSRTAELLGFEGVIENAMDASTTRDMLVESVNSVATLGLTCSSVAEDGIIFSNRGFIELNDDYASTSSIMPQKKNPDTLELVRAAAGEVIGCYTGLATTLKGLPRAYNRDLQRATTYMWDAVDAAQDAVDVTAGAISTATWNTSKLQSAAGEGFSTATGVADLLAQNGIPFRIAHEIVATAAEPVEEADETETAVELLDEAGEEVFGEAVTNRVEIQQLLKALDPTANVAARDSRGGPAPEELTRAIADAKNRLDEDHNALDNRKTAVKKASKQLTAEVDNYV